MIHEAKNKLIDRGFNTVKRLEDPFGTIGYLMSYEGDEFVLVAKEYSYDNRASFIEGVFHMVPTTTDFIFYCDSDERFTVFDGKYLRENYTPSKGQSKKREVEWRELDRSYGVDLDVYVEGTGSPVTLAGDNLTLGVF